eukprot:TRINITY_DN59496_c0_g1_i2.p1 TRINITY_DN59496_c0_g1~~TRINITY_DN59496_c0_g1_i2.p1  ORF type:complete len:502 (+),score=71.94 TRINITY_DN59496_c0_g1_i2:126-1631(+)
MADDLDAFVSDVMEKARSHDYHSRSRNAGISSPTKGTYSQGYDTSYSPSRAPLLGSDRPHSPGSGAFTTPFVQTSSSSSRSPLAYQPGMVSRTLRAASASPYDSRLDPDPSSLRTPLHTCVCTSALLLAILAAILTGGALALVVMSHRWSPTVDLFRASGPGVSVFPPVLAGVSAYFLCGVILFLIIFAMNRAPPRVHTRTFCTSTCRMIGGILAAALAVVVVLGAVFVVIVAVAVAIANISPPTLEPVVTPVPSPVPAVAHIHSPKDLDFASPGSAPAPPAVHYPWDLLARLSQPLWDLEVRHTDGRSAPLCAMQERLQCSGWFYVCPLEAAEVPPLPALGGVRGWVPSWVHIDDTHDCLRCGVNTPTLTPSVWPQPHPHPITHTDARDADTSAVTAAVDNTSAPAHFPSSPVHAPAHAPVHVPAAHAPVAPPTSSTEGDHRCFVAAVHETRRWGLRWVAVGVTSAWFVGSFLLCILSLVAACRRSRAVPMELDELTLVE